MSPGVLGQDCVCSGSETSEWDSIFVKDKLRYHLEAGLEQEQKVISACSILMFGVTSEA